MGDGDSNSLLKKGVLSQTGRVAGLDTGSVNELVTSCFGLRRRSLIPARSPPIGGSVEPDTATRLLTP